MIECQGCGVKNADDSSHCRMCGGPLSFGAAFPGRSIKTLPSPPQQADTMNDRVSSGTTAPIGGFIGLIIGVIISIFSFQKLGEFSSGIGQLAVAVSKEAAQEKSNYQFLAVIGVVVAIISLGFIIHHYATKPPSDPEKVLVICPHCQARSPEGQGYCGSCGQKL